MARQRKWWCATKASAKLAAVLSASTLGFKTGMRESAQSRKEPLVDLKARGLSIAPEIDVGDGALGFWRALDEAFPPSIGRIRARRTRSKAHSRRSGIARRA
jgi:hypothetical protein